MLGATETITGWPAALIIFALLAVFVVGIVVVVRAMKRGHNALCGATANDWSFRIYRQS
jgi:hypothetical protein